MLISEDYLDELFEKSAEPIIPFDMMSGINIKTSCYGLFLVGLDLNTDQYQKNLLNAALDRVHNITDSTAFHSLYLLYPLDDISVQSILGLAKAVILLDNVTYGRQAHEIPPGTIDSLMMGMTKTLELRANVIEMVSDNE